MEFLADLVDLFQNDNNLRNWLRSLITNKINIGCRHTNNIPNGVETCGRYTNPRFKRKRVRVLQIRKSTIWRRAITHLGYGDANRYPSLLSTKIDVSTLMIPLSYPDENLEDLIIEWMHEKYKVFTCMWMWMFTTG